MSKVSDTGPNKFGGRRILLTPVGSLGDVHPYLALAQELARRGHRPVVATLPSFRERVEAAAGVEFAPLRAAAAEVPSPELMQRVFAGRRGIEYILRGLILPALRLAYADTLEAAKGADLLVAHPLSWATGLVAEVRGLPWVSTQLAPTGMFSALDPPLLPGMEPIYRLPLGRLRPGVWRGMFRLAEAITRRWMRPYDALRRDLGLPAGENPMFAGGHAPLRELALFSPAFCAPQPDWPAQSMATGFPFFDQAIAPDPALEALERWLEAGPAPVVFTLGSSAVMNPGDFFGESALAARRLGRRALLVGPGTVGSAARPVTNGSTLQPGADVFTIAYGSYAAIFPRAVAAVHQGGIGTTAEALRAGIPMLVVPFGVDQPDNAARIARLGVGRVLQRSRYRERRVTRELRLLLERPAFAANARALAATVQAERGAAKACDALEALLP